MSDEVAAEAMAVVDGGGGRGDHGDVLFGEQVGVRIPGRLAGIPGGEGVGEAAAFFDGPCDDEIVAVRQRLGRGGGGRDGDGGGFGAGGPGDGGAGGGEHQCGGREGVWGIGGGIFGIELDDVTREGLEICAGGFCFDDGNLSHGKDLATLWGGFSFLNGGHRRILSSK